MPFSLTEARQQLRTAFNGDFRAITRILRALIDGEITPRAVVSVADATTYTVLAENSGKTHILPNFTANCTLTLPAAAAGLEYTFIGKAVAADAQNWIFAAGVPYLGGIVHLDTDDAVAPDQVVLFPNGSSNDNLTVITPSAGTCIYFACDGTNWIVNGVAVSVTIPTFAD